MEIIQRHYCKGMLTRPLRKLRLIVYSGLLILLSLFIYTFLIALSNEGSFMPCVICAVVAVFEIFILKIAQKTRRNILMKQDQSRYRYDEIEFGDDCVWGRDYNYYASSMHSIKYQSIKKICFTKADIYIFFMNMLAIAFSRADMSEAEESALTELLKQKLPVKRFNAARIPKRNTAGCIGIQLTPEKEIINLFPETAVSYKPSSEDFMFASTYNYVSGKKTNFVSLLVFFGILSLLLAGLWATGAMIESDFLLALMPVLCALCFFVFLVLILLLVAIKIRIKTLDKISALEIAVTDYFFKYKVLYGDGTFLSTAYNLAGLLGISEMRGYFLLVTAAGSVAVPKSVFSNLETLRQIFAKELGPKFRYFPDK